MKDEGRQLRWVRVRAALAVAMLVATSIMWIGSLSHGGAIYASGGGATMRLDTAAGTMTAMWWRPDPGDRGGLHISTWKVPAGAWPGAFQWRRLGFRWGLRIPNVGWTQAEHPMRFVTVPYWAVVLILCPWAARAWLILWRGRRRHGGRFEVVPEIKQP